MMQKSYEVVQPGNECCRSHSTEFDIRAIHLYEGVCRSQRRAFAEAARVAFERSGLSRAEYRVR